MEAAEFVRPAVPVVSLAKGIEQGTLRRMTEVIGEVLPTHLADRIGVLTGPNLARGRSRAAGGVGVAMGDEAVAHELQRLIMTVTFRVYTNPDVVGCEIASALKNVMAIAAGIADGLGYGDNTKAALLTRGLAELTRLGISARRQPTHVLGAGRYGRPRRHVHEHPEPEPHRGRRAREGPKLDDIVADMKMVAEGVKSTAAVLELALRHPVEMPIAEQVGAVLYEGKRAEDLVTALMLARRRPNCTASHESLGRNDGRDDVTERAPTRTGCSARPTRLSSTTAARSRPMAGGGSSTGGSVPTIDGTSRRAKPPVRQTLVGGAGRRDVAAVPEATQAPPTASAARPASSRWR